MMDVIVLGKVDEDIQLQWICQYLDSKSIKYTVYERFGMKPELIDSQIIVSHDVFSAKSFEQSFQSIMVCNVPRITSEDHYPNHIIFSKADQSEVEFRLQAFLHEETKFVTPESLYFDALFNSSSSLVVLVDKHGVIEQINKPLDAVDVETFDLFVSRGKVINCIHAMNMHGCGGGSNCQSCDIRSQSESVFQTKENVLNKECKAYVVNQHGVLEEKVYVISTYYIEIDGMPKALMVIDEKPTDESSHLADATSDFSIAMAQKQLDIAAEVGKIAIMELDAHTFVSRGNKVWMEFLDTDIILQDFDQWGMNISPEHYKDLVKNLTAVVRGDLNSFDLRFSYSKPQSKDQLWLQSKFFVSESDELGMPTKLMCIAQDITKKVYTEETIRKQQANQKALLENTDARIWLVNNIYNIVEMNNQFKRNFKMLFDIHYNVGDSFLIKLPTEYAKRWRKLLDKAFLGETVIASDTIKFQKSERYFETRLTPVWVDETVIAVSCFLTEVTVQKRYEKMLKYARKSAESANAAKSQFLANMSHEIRTPLNAILGFSEILEATESKPVNKGYLNSIKKSGNMLLSIINDVLDLSKIEAGKININPEFSDLHSLLSETFEPFLFRAKQKQLSFKFTINDLDGLFLFADGFRLRQIMLNLLSNALKFTEQGGITCNAVLQEVSDKTADLVLQVSDTGIGIDPEQIEAIFNPFLQQENQDNRKYQGTGLGLSITKQLAEAMGGTIQVESKENKGSLFTVKLPGLEYKKQKALPKADTSKSNKPSAFVGKLAFVVDDIAEHRQVISGYLKLYGMRTMFATNGADIFELLKTVTPDVIIMDIRMPEMNGYEAFDKLQTKSDWKTIPVVAVTAEVFANEVEHMKTKGFSGFVRKPIQLNSFHDVLLEIFSEKNVTKVVEQSPYADVPSDVQERIVSLASSLKRKQPRKDLLKLADLLEDEGKSLKLINLQKTGAELRIATTQFNVVKIRKIISQLEG